MQSGGRQAGRGKHIMDATPAAHRHLAVLSPWCHLFDAKEGDVVVWRVDDGQLAAVAVWPHLHYVRIHLGLQRR